MGRFLAECIAAGHICIGHRPGFGQLAARVDRTRQQVGRRCAARLTGQTHVQNRFDLIKPRHFHSTAAEQHHNRMWVGGGNRLDQTDMSLGHRHILAVKALGLVNIGQARADNGNFRLFCGVGGLAQRFLGHFALGVAACSKRHIGQRITKACQLCRVDVARACALITHRAGHLANQHNIFCLQRQDTILIFKQYRAVFGDFLRQCVVGVPVKGTAFGAVLPFQRQGDHPRSAGIHIGFGQRTAPHGLGHAVLHVGAAARHTQIAPGMHGGHAAAQCAPVGYDHAVKAPVPAQHLGQQPGIIAGMYIVDTRIAAHDGFRLGSLDDGFKRGQVQLAHRAFVNLAVAVEALVLLIVGGKVLETGARAALLRTLHPCRAHGARNVGVLGEILEIAPAQRVALDVDAGAKHDVHTVGKSLLADGFALGLQQLGIPRCTARHGGGKAGRRLGLVHAQHVGAVFLAAHAVGTVAHRNGGDAVLRHRLAVPEIRTVAKADFIFQRHLRQNVLYFFIHYDCSLSAWFIAASTCSNSGLMLSP